MQVELVRLISIKMEKVSDLIKIYSLKTNIELYDISLEIETYTEEAKVAFKTVINSRGGIEVVNEEYNLKVEKNIEKVRIEKEIRDILKFDKHSDINYNLIKSDIFNDKEKEKIIDNVFETILNENNDKNVSSKTIVFGIIGGVISSLTSGFLWGVQMIASGRIHLLITFLFIFMNFLFISGFTKKSIKNPVVFLLTVIFSILSFAFGGIIYKNNWTIDYMLSLIV